MDDEPVLSLNSGAGSLDVTFSDDGMLFTQLGHSDDAAYAMAEQSDGKIVVVGTSNEDFAVVRYNSDWTLDTTFGGGDGWVTTDLGGWDVAYSVAIQSNGMIVVGGRSYDDFAVARYGSSGNLDTSFSGDGKATVDFGTFVNPQSDFVYAITLQSDGKIVAVGETRPNSGHDFAVARINADGPVAIDTELTLTDADDTNMLSASIQITGNYQSAEDSLGIDSSDLRGGVSANWNSATGVLTLNGSASKADYEFMLAHVTYTNTNSNPNTADRTVTWTVSDGDDDSAGQTSTISIKHPPMLSDLDTLAYTENDTATVIDDTITLTDLDSANMTSATIQIMGNYASGEDSLTIDSGDLFSGVKAKWNSSTGTLTLTGPETKAHYQSMLEHVKYQNTSEDPSTADRTVTWTVNDGTADSAPQMATVAVVENPQPRPVPIDPPRSPQGQEGDVPPLFSTTAPPLVQEEAHAVESLVSFLVENGLLTSHDLGNAEQGTNDHLNQWESLFSEALFEKSVDERDHAWDRLFSLAENSKEHADAGIGLNLEEFLTRMRQWRIGVDTEQILLASNADDIKLSEWFGSMMSSAEGHTHGMDNSESPPTSYVWGHTFGFLKL